MKISFLTSGHFPYDDRIFFHLGKTLSGNGHKIEIVSSKSSLKESSEGISVNCFEGDDMSKKMKVNCFTEFLDNHNPDIIICSEPLPVLAAKQFKRKNSRRIIIVYDITEWYPSKKNLASYKSIFRWIVFTKLLIFNLLTSCYVDAFIFGEWYKSRPYRFLFPFRPFIFIAYYPDLKYINIAEPSIGGKKLKLSYSGKISIEKGFRNFINVVNAIAEKNPGLKIEVKIIGWFESIHDRKVCEPLLKLKYENICVSFSGKQEFKEFIKQISDTDIFIDLRDDNTENQYCLPIKLFYYVAMQRPVIFSDLKAIHREVEIGKFGFLVKPYNIDQIIEIIKEYLQNPELYVQHCRNARRLAEAKYNWQQIAPGFLKFIDSLSSL